MSQITNKDLVKALFDGARMPVQETPAELGKTVVPVLDGTPDFHRITNLFLSQSATASGGATIASTSTTKETYINNIIFSWHKDATCDMATGSVAVTGVINGITRSLARFTALTLTLQSGVQVINFIGCPIKLDKGTDILIESDTFTVGAMVRNATMFGYEVDN